jgi:hypothetical protein
LVHRIERDLIKNGIKNIIKIPTFSQPKTDIKFER